MPGKFCPFNGKSCNEDCALSYRSEIFDGKDAKGKDRYKNILSCSIVMIAKNIERIPKSIDTFDFNNRGTLWIYKEN
jgi:hypothetical protein